MTTVALARLEPASPTVDRAVVWMDTVKLGTMVRQVRGPGTLVPEQIRYVSAVTAGRVEALLVEPGAEVTPETVLLMLSNPDVHLQEMEAERQLAASRSGLSTLRASLENQRLTQEGAVASANSQLREAVRQAEVNRALVDRGLIARLEKERTDDVAVELAIRLEIEEKRLEFLEASTRAQLAEGAMEIERLEALAAMRRSEAASLSVTAGAAGILRDLSLQEGEWVGPGARLAVVVRPGRLKAELRIPETQARDLALGLPATIDTRNGIVPGR
ncbi:MAG TPA: HlyD family efflux transporter periplasmic adaptor subunit, partial [Longimicrobiaceae bacterium]|nr:HlyD family efflux transporter periplasmic adaptor subunit [Longimicrobiaceae bacterium]